MLYLIVSNELAIQQFKMVKDESDCMKNRWNAVFGSALLLAAPFAVADCTPDNCSAVYVDNLYVNENGLVYVGTSGNEASLNCSAVSGVYVSLHANAVGRDMIYSTLLAAQTQSKKVMIQVEDNSAGCRIQYVTLERVQ